MFTYKHLLHKPNNIYNQKKATKQNMNTQDHIFIYKSAFFTQTHKKYTNETLIKAPLRPLNCQKKNATINNSHQKGIHICDKKKTNTCKLPKTHKGYR